MFLLKLVGLVELVFFSNCLWFSFRVQGNQNALYFYSERVLKKYLCCSIKIKIQHELTGEDANCFYRDRGPWLVSHSSPSTFVVPFDEFWKLLFFSCRVQQVFVWKTSRLVVLILPLKISTTSRVNPVMYAVCWVHWVTNYRLTTAHCRVSVNAEIPSNDMDQCSTSRVLAKGCHDFEVL